MRCVARFRTRLQVCNFTKINTPPWVFFTFYKLYKWYQIAQRTTYEIRCPRVIPFRKCDSCFTPLYKFFTKIIIGNFPRQKLRNFLETFVVNVLQYLLICETGDLLRITNSFEKQLNLCFLTRLSLSKILSS